MTLHQGTRLGPYEILQPLGAGGMGEVYRARDTRVDRTVAVKVLPRHLAETPARRRRWEREARAISNLSHPHVCAFHDIGEQDGIAFIVMEYLAGSTLARRLARGALSLKDALRYAVEIADALDHAHRQGVVHRDLKPANIMLTTTGAKLLDFGLAAFQPEHDGEGDHSRGDLAAMDTLTEEGSMLGTTPYMAPEQLEAGAVDARSDIFAFGAVLYEMIAGRRAFAGASRASIIAAILSRDPEPLSTGLPHVTAAGMPVPLLLEQIIRRCLARNPDDRWQTARDLRGALEWVADAQPGVAAAPNVGDGRRRRRVWAIGASIAVGVPAMLLLMVRPRDATEAPAYQFTVPPPAGMTFNESNAFMAVSPDGRSLVFSASTPRGTPALWLQALDSLAAAQLPGTEDAVQPFWSADSRFVAFAVKGVLRTIEVATGRVSTLGAGGISGSWNQDGVIVIGRPFGPPGQRALWRVGVSDGVEAPVTPAGSSGLWPQFLPDGRNFVYVADGERAGQGMLYLGTLDSLDHTPLLESDSQGTYAWPGYLLHMRGSTLVAQPFDATQRRATGTAVPVVAEVDRGGNRRGAFSVSQTGVLAYRPARQTELVWHDRNGAAVERVGAPGHYGNPTLSPDGRLLAVSRTDPGRAASVVWIVNLSDRTENRLMVDSGMSAMPLFTPDGRHIVYRSTDQSVSSFIVRAIDGSTPDRRLVGGLNPKATPLGWIGEGRTLMFDDVGLTSQLDLLTVSGDHEATTVPVLRTPFSESQGQLSRDGRWLAYVSDESGRNQVFVRSVGPNERRWLVAPEGGLEPQWRADGGELFYLAPDRSLMAVSIRTEPAFAAGQPARLFGTRMSTLQNGAFIRNQYLASPDGRRFLINQQVEGASAITVMINWLARLPREAT